VANDSIPTGRIPTFNAVFFVSIVLAIGIGGWGCSYGAEQGPPDSGKYS
jgi:hypothetical protein